MNYDMIDKFTDKIYVLNTSIGVGQVRVSTAKELEDLGYVEPVTYVGGVVEWHGNGHIRIYTGIRL